MAQILSLPLPRRDLPSGQDGLSHCVPGILPTAFCSAAILVRRAGTVHILRTFINMTVWAISINHFFWLLLFCGLFLRSPGYRDFGGTKEKHPDGRGWIAACKIANLNIFTLLRYRDSFSFLWYAVDHSGWGGGLDRIGWDGIGLGWRSNNKAVPHANECANTTN